MIDQSHDPNHPSYEARPDRTYPGCKAHGLDPCPECDSQ